MTNYWLIKALLLVALLLIAWLVLRPVRSSRHLAVRRLGMLLVVVFAVFAVLFPGLLNELAHALGIERGVNLLLYVLVVAFFVQVATTYRRDSEIDKRLTRLARAVALANVCLPAEVPPSCADTRHADPPHTPVDGDDIHRTPSDDPGA